MNIVIYVFDEGEIYSSRISCSNKLLLSRDYDASKRKYANEVQRRDPLLRRKTASGRLEKKRLAASTISGVIRGRDNFSARENSPCFTSARGKRSRGRVA